MRRGSSIFKVAQLAGALISLSLAAAAPSFAADYPSRMLTLVVPFPAGSVTDTQGRAMARAFEERMGQTVVVENRPGAAGAVGANYIATSVKPDGYTLGFISTAALASFPQMQKTTINPRTDLEYVIGMTGYTLGLMVRTDSPWHSIEDLMAGVHKEPNRFTFATSPRLSE